MKKLIAYYSRPGENYFDGRYTYLPTGITQFASKKLSELLPDADVFRIEMEEPYSSKYEVARTQAQLDKENQARPALRTWPENIEQYDEIWLGYPNFCGTMPMVVYTFLEGLDLQGKTIHPFCTHEGDGMCSTREEIAQAAPGSVVTKGLAIKASSIQSSLPDLKDWAESN